MMILGLILNRCYMVNFLISRFQGLFVSIPKKSSEDGGLSNRVNAVAENSIKSEGLLVGFPKKSFEDGGLNDTSKLVLTDWSVSADAERKVANDPIKQVLTNEEIFDLFEKNLKLKVDKDKYTIFDPVKSELQRMIGNQDSHETIKNYLINKSTSELSRTVNNGATEAQAKLFLEDEEGPTKEYGIHTETDQDYEVRKSNIEQQAKDLYDEISKFLQSDASKSICRGVFQDIDESKLPKIIQLLTYYVVEQTQQDNFAGFQNHAEIVANDLWKEHTVNLLPTTNTLTHQVLTFKRNGKIGLDRTYVSDIITESIMEQRFRNNDRWVYKNGIKKYTEECPLASVVYKMNTKCDDLVETFCKYICDNNLLNPGAQETKHKAPQSEISIVLLDKNPGEHDMKLVIDVLNDLS